MQLHVLSCNLLVCVTEAALFDLVHDGKAGKATPRTLECNCTPTSTLAEVSHSFEVWFFCGCSGWCKVILTVSLEIA